MFSSYEDELIDKILVGIKVYSYSCPKTVYVFFKIYTSRNTKSYQVPIIQCGKFKIKPKPLGSYFQVSSDWTR